MIGGQPVSYLGDPFLIQCSACGVAASGDVPCIFVCHSTARTEVLDCSLPSREVLVAPIEVRDMSSYPILKRLRESLHDFRNDFPIDEVKATPWNFVPSAK